jgi:two-component sensor histidine kinase
MVAHGWRALQGLRSHLSLVTKDYERSANVRVLTRRRGGVRPLRAEAARARRRKRGPRPAARRARLAALRETLYGGVVQTPVLPAPWGDRFSVACLSDVRELEVGNGQVFGRVVDDGSGFDPEAVGKASPSWGMGLRSMAERAEMLGGELRVASRPGAGTRMEVRIPLDGRGP